MEIITELNGEHLVVKSNVLNEMRAVGWTNRELRFLSAYLSKIDSTKPTSRDMGTVRFTLSAFAKIMEIKRVYANDIELMARRLHGKSAETPKYDGEGKPTGGYKLYHLFSTCEVEKDENGRWYIEFVADNEALPLFFEIKDKFTKYQLFNVMQLAGDNHFRMFEILKQYENWNNGIFEITIEELKVRLGIDSKSYTDKTTGKSVWRNFSRKVLDSCQKAIAEKTDIKYTYEPIKRGKGKTSPVVGVRFKIEKNDRAIQLNLEDHIICDDIEMIEPESFKIKNEYIDPHLKALATAFEDTIDEPSMAIIKREMPYLGNKFSVEYNFLHEIYLDLNRRKARIDLEPIKNDVSWVISEVKRRGKEFKIKLMGG